ncbi:MAG: DUF1501 domain-containing protein [Ilumatobacteraceae bacterium]
MLDPDIHTEDALALLTSHELDDERPGPHGWTRRRFLGALGAGAFGGAAIGALGSDLFGTGGVPDAWAAAGPLAADEGTIIVVTLYGGFDGLNVVVPYTSGTYYNRRPSIALKASEVLPVNDEIAFHPALSKLKARFNNQQVAVVQGVGYANPDLSHFTSMAIWMRGWLGAGGAPTGWVGRYLDGLPADQADLAGVSLGSGVPFHMQGANRRGVGVPVGVTPFGASTLDADARLFTGLRLAGAPAGRGPWHDQFTSVLTRQLDVGAQLGPTMSQAITASDGDVTRKLVTAARLLNADVGLRIIDVGTGGYDTHTNQNFDTGLPRLLRDLDSGIERFYQELQPGRHDRVTILVVSEFGRTVGENGTLGTDHGTVNPSFVIGTRVKGGLYGQMPSLTNLDSNGRMRPTVDFRSVYGSILDPWLAGAGGTVLGGSFQDLGLFVAGPGPLPPPPPTPAPVLAPSPEPTPEPTPVRGLDRSAPSGFVNVAPQRIVDTRLGFGAAPLGPDSTVTIDLADRYGIPADATSVLLNITAIEPTGSTYLLAWSGSLPRPLASSSNVDAGEIRASLVIAKLSDAGSCAIYNLTGDLHIAVDLLGWFTPSSDLRVASARPRRLLDTRDSARQLTAAEGTLNVPVHGWAGVDQNVEAVMLNVTATDATDSSFLTVWDAGSAHPGTSNLNVSPRTTAANAAVAALGTDGRLSIATNTGSTHVVVDVMATFARGGSGRVVALDPSRVLDSRVGLGTPAGWHGGAVMLPLVGIGGVPVGGAAAVILSVVAIEPTQDSHVSVYPAGSSRPGSSNLNVAAGTIVSNLVMVELGYGAVTLESSAAHVHLVADVVGYVTG